MSRLHKESMSNNVDVEVPDNEHKRKFSVRKFINSHARMEKNLLVFLILVSVSLDPLFFYIPIVNNDSNCLGSDSILRIVLVIFRSLVDGVYIILLLRQRHGLASVYKKQYQRVTFGIAAILAILPLAQVVVYASSWRLLTVKLLKFMVLIQFVPRVFLLIRTYRYARRRTYRTRHLWMAAAFYLSLFTLASHVLGAFWYLRAIERNMDCWRKACKIRDLCGISSFYCNGSSSDNRYLDEFCQIPPASNSTFFDHGIYIDAFQKEIISFRTKFRNKFFYCFWWGLRSLSSLGQNLKPGAYIWDNFFAIFIVIFGLVLLALLIGNMQVYLQKETASDVELEIQKQERMAKLKRELDGWVPSYKLSLDLKEKIKKCEDENWLRTTEINLKTLLNNTPVELRGEIRLQLCKDLFSQVPDFVELPNVIQTELRERAKAAVFQPRSIICKEGYPIYEMIHVVEGKVLAFSRYSNIKEESRLEAHHLKRNDFTGKELLENALQSSKPDLPLARESFQAVTKVEAFTLSFDDFVAVFTEHGNMLKSPYKLLQTRNKIKWALAANTFNRRKPEEQPPKEEYKNDKL